MDDLDQRLRASAAPPQGELDVADTACRARRRRRRRQVGSGLGATVLVAVVALGVVGLLDGAEPDVVLDGDAAVEPETFPRPEPGEVVAITAPDGRPAFLVGSDAGVRAFRAVEPLSHGMRELVVWCRPAESFFTPFAGSEWTIDGGYLGGPAPGDLVPYRTEVDGEQVTVGRAQPRPHRAYATDPSADGLRACRGERATERPARSDTPASMPVDPQVTVSHTYADQDWPSLEQALANADGPTTVNARLALTAGSGRSFRACSAPAGDPPRCPDDAPVVDSLDDVDEERSWMLWRGYARVETDGTTITGFDYWVTVTQHQGEESPRAQRGARQRQRELEQARQDLGPSDRVVVDANRITVPATEWSLGAAPDEPIAAGVYELVFENHGEIDHTLVNDRLGVDLETSASPDYLTDSTRVALSPGTYTFYCRVPGHREHGEEVELVVGEAQRGASPPG